MEYISAEEFLKLSDGVQDIFMNWWQPELFDLAFHIERRELNEPTMISRIFNDDNLIIIGEYLHIATFKDNLIPLFTESQLRKFIEDKTNLPCGLIPRWINNKVRYQVQSYEERKIYLQPKYTSLLYESAIFAYWQVARIVASEEVSNE